MARRNSESGAKSKYNRWPNRTGKRRYGKGKFEIPEEALREDLFRAKSLTNVKRLTDLKMVKKAKKLAEQLGRVRVEPPTLASSRHMRKLRIVRTRMLWKMVDDAGATPVSFFTIIPRHWEVSGDDLHLINPRLLLESLRVVLYRRGAAKALGRIELGLHGEHEPNEDVWRLHVHGIATGGMIEVVDKLRKLPNYRSFRSRVGKKGPVFQRVKMTREPLTDLPDPLSYTVQSFWPARSIFELNDEDTARQTRKRRIAEPHHTHFLLWLDRWSLSDLTLSIGSRKPRSN